MLENCEFTFKKVELKSLAFAPTISYNNGDKSISVENPNINEILPLIPLLLNGEFSPDLSKVIFDATIAIRNPNIEKVIVDSMVLSTYLDDTEVGELSINDYLEIEPNSIKDEVVRLKIPLNSELLNVMNSKTVKLKGTVWMNIDVVDGFSTNIPVPISISREIPREEIKNAMNSEMKNIQKMFIELGGNSGLIQNLMKGFF